MKIILKKSQKPIEMEGAHALLRGDVKYATTVEGTVNGQAFKIEGGGMGNAEKGYQRGTFVCTSGKLPMSWEVMAPTLGYGLKIFTKHPNGIPSLEVQSFPEGYIQDRTTTFENDGTIKTRHEIYLEEGTVVSKVVFKADGFKDDSPIINDGVYGSSPGTLSCYPMENCVRSMTPIFFPLKNPVGDNKYAVCMADTYYRPRGNQKNINVPGCHFVAAHIETSRDVNETRDHTCIHEALVASNAC